MSFKSIGRASIAAAILTLVGCSDEGGVVILDETAQAVGTSTEASSATANIVDTAIAAETFTTLVAALQATGLDAVLADDSKTYTVFAPTDAAFEKLGQDTINALLGDTDTLSDILLYHVFPDAAVDSTTAIGLAGSMIEMANGDEVAVVLSEGKLFINQSEVSVTDIEASNGVIHVIDTVLLPPEDMPVDAESPSMNIVETAVAAGSFNTLAQALVATGLVDTLSNPDDQFTVFAPTDDAFAKLPEGTLESLLANPEALTDILLYHVIGGSSVDSTTAISLAGQSVAVANGDTVAISLVDGQLLINDSVVTAADVNASNGVIHVIDTVLLPPTDEPSSDEPASEDPVETPMGTILEIAQNTADLSTLVTAIGVAGLDGALGHPGDTYTVFAPTNAAFEALGADTLNAVIADPDALRNILLLHVIPGTVVDAATAQSLVGFDVQAGNGSTLTLTHEGDDLLINGAKIIATDIHAANGVIHLIDAVLLP